jgi:hypothetical protein
MSLLWSWRFAIWSETVERSLWNVERKVWRESSSLVLDWTCSCSSTYSLATAVVNIGNNCQPHLHNVSNSSLSSALLSPSRPMPSRYERVPNPSDDTHEDELEAAFDDSSDSDDSDSDEQELESIGEQEHRPVVSETFSRPSITPHYDFERVDYDHPPPGSPPRPSASALPANAAYGNTNGLIPTSPTERPSPHRSAYTKWLSSVIPFYDRWRTSRRPQGRIGGGAENDGVFANLMSKPTRARRVEDENGIHFVPEETQAEPPPVSFI